MKARPLIEQLLAEQRELTAVERFAQRHEGARWNAGFYQDLIPVHRPAGDEQYAFRVDLDICTGCKACVSACHALNGLDEHETWRTVGLLHGGTSTRPYQQTVTAACHHCLEPACLEGCPVLAYEKDPATGIVRHLDDQCIGCQYCVLKCPYEVPKYSAQRGIVRKCDLCHGRLTAGEPPACVQACPTGAISIQIVSRREVADATADPDSRLVPGAFRSDYTRPTTSYVSRRPFPANCEPADTGTLRLEPAHWPLVWMLILTQAAAGVFVAAELAVGSGWQAAVGVLALTGWLTLLLGLGVSVFHLGRPLRAWRSFLGWRTSWMSREIIAFGLFAAAGLGLVIGSRAALERDALSWLGGWAAGAGIVAVICSAMIYVDTRRDAWKAAAVFGRFFGTTLLLGASISACCLAWMASSGQPGVAAAGRWAAWLATAVRIALFVWENASLRSALERPGQSAHHFARVCDELLPGLRRVRAALFFLSTGFGLSALMVSGMAAAMCATVSLVCTLAAQVGERYTFFVASGQPGMPGGVKG